MARRDEQTDLFALPAERNAKLKIALANANGLTDQRRIDLERLISFLEEKTGASGTCDLSRIEIAKGLTWGRTLCGVVLGLAKALEWIEVESCVDSRGSQTANRTRVRWDRIGRRPHADPVSQCDQGGSYRDRGGSQCDQGSPAKTKAKEEGNFAPYQETIPTPQQESNSIGTMDHGSIGSLRKFSWGQEVTREDLRSVRTLIGVLFTRAVEQGAAKDCDHHRLRFVAWACEVDRTWNSMTNPIGNFTGRMTSPDRYGKTWLQRGTKRDEQKAISMLDGLYKSQTKSTIRLLPKLRDPDEAIAANLADQETRMTERWGIDIGTMPSARLMAAGVG